MKWSINTILPLALAIILPGLSFYTNEAISIPEGLGLVGSWFATSLSLYILWYLLWYAWRVPSIYRIGAFILASVGFSGLLFAGFYLFFYDSLPAVKWYPFLRIVLASVVFLAIQYALKIQAGYAKLQVEKEQLQTENYKAQLKAIQANIDPHFLFNSLNTLRSMVRQGHANSEKFIVSLSDFYRQTLKHHQNTTLPLLEELAVLESYLFVMKNRNEEAIQLEIEIDESLLSLHLPTLALQVVVENCFKHNSMTRKMPLHVSISSTGDQFIEVKNNLQPKLEPEIASGHGLDFLRRRYALLKVEHGVQIEQSTDHFKVRLKLIPK